MTQYYPHHCEQIGDYVVELLDARDWWHVRMAGAEEVMSVHNTKKDAKAAVRIYQQADRRRGA